MGCVQTGRALGQPSAVRPSGQRKTCGVQQTWGSQANDPMSHSPPHADASLLFPVHGERIGE